MVFAVMALAWFAYGIPQVLGPTEARPSGPDEDEAADRLPESVDLIGADGETFAVAAVSTPLTRRAEAHRLRRIDRAAVRIRRRVLVATLAGELALVVACVLGWAAWWTLGIGGGALVAVLVGLRISVVLVERELACRLAELRAGGQESTVTIDRHELGIGRRGRGDPSLWEPLPVPAPTYLQRPPMARTVRTIDLSGPEPGADPARGALPVTADRPGSADDPPSPPSDADPPRLRAVGE